MFGWFKKESAVERALRLADDKLASLDYDGAEEMLKPIAAESSEAVSILAKIYSGKTQDYEKLLDNYDKMLELEQYVNSDNISDYTKNMRILFRRLGQKANHLYHKGEISAASLITSRLAAHKNDIGNIEGKSYSMPQGNDAHAENNYAPSENNYAPSENSYAPSENSYAPSENSYAPSENSYAPSENSYDAI